MEAYKVLAKYMYLGSLAGLCYKETHPNNKIDFAY
jgi:hypothetical protein